MYRILFLIVLFTVISFIDLYGAGELQPDKISGIVVDAETDEPVSFAYIHLVEINRTATTDRNGKFQFSNVPEGNYVIAVHRMGYVTQRYGVRVEPDENTEVHISLNPTVLTGQAVEVVADPEIIRGANIRHATIYVMGDQLRRNLGATLSETLDNQAGFSQRTMGPAPGRPVIRGLGDERVIILQDGRETGDVSWTSPDHAVTVDPSSADEIEIARGPSALLYGSNAIGGVVNVVRNQIPNSVPTSLTGNMALLGATVNQGLTAAGASTVPVDDFVINLDLNVRSGGNYSTPDRTLTNTSMRSTQNTLAGSYIRPWGYAGLSGSMYVSEYGIPPDPEGGHPAGVDVEMQKYQADARSEVMMDDSFFKLLEMQGSVIFYQHKEIEAGGIIGTEYLKGTNTATAKIHHKDWSIVDDGVIGVSGEIVSNAVRGTSTPDSRIFSGSIFTLQEADLNLFHLQAGLRLDHVVTRPVREKADSPIGHIRRRSFTALASSVSATYELNRSIQLGSSIMHSFRPPSFEELYSEGPHLAAYSYEIGNPDLDPERGLGTELFFRYEVPNAKVELSGYYNRFGNYLYAQDTGERSPRRGDLNLYQYVGTKASIYGMELSTEFEIRRDFVFHGNLSYTVGDRMVTEHEKQITGLEKSEQPLPMMPPLQSTAGLRYSNGPFTVDGQLRTAARQSRTGEFETETPGYAIVNLSTQYRFSTERGLLHTFSLSVQNLFDETYYNHLSRIKEVFPEPGRNVKLLYRVYF